MNRLKSIEKELAPLRNQLNNHKLYSTLNNIEDVKTFMEQHVFAVWDFMSLLKSLQNHLTTTTLPWIPAKNTATARFINEIVFCEETDVNEKGEPKSHFEMYLDAMHQIGADTNPISNLVSQIENGKSVTEACKAANLNTDVTSFIQFTFDIINTSEPHKIASAFTFGREDVIPDMFLQIVNSSNSSSKLKYYLERHIELDGDEHGPLSLKMIEELCGEDTKKWEEVTLVAKQALDERIKLWDAITKMIQEKKVASV